MSDNKKPRIALYNRYRPQKFQDVVEQDAVKQILSNELQSGNLKRVLLFTGGAGTGKAQPLYSKVLTPTGFVNMGDVKIGMEVFTASGNIAKISEIFPQGKRAIYEITLQDDTKIRVADNHLNCVYRYNQRLKQREDFVWETTKLIEEFKNQKYKLRIDIPEVDFKHQEVLINPYLLGCLIGDGSLSNSLGFTCAESDILDKVNSILKQDYGMILKHKTKYDYNIHYIENPNHNGSKGDKGQHDLVRNYDVLKTLKGQLDFYKLLCKSLDKHIPKEYLYNSKEVRLALLQGLYDTDGWKGGRCYSTSSKQLAQDFLFLVRSLGIRATIKESIGKYNGILCNTHYTIHLKPNKEMRIFSSKKHYANYLQQQQEPMRNIKSIEYIGEEECQCIMVDHPDHTYISDDFIPTHNTTSARIYANEIEPTASNIIEINCADHTGVDDVRSLVIDASKSKPLSGKYKIFVLDECFAKGTKVTTNDGVKNIEDIIPGTYVQHMNGFGKVTHVFNNTVKTENLVFIKINGQSLITTKDHLFFTNEGWVKAQDLRNGDILYDRETMSKLSENIYDLRQEVLQPKMLGRIQAEKEVGKRSKKRNSSLCDLSERISGSSKIDSENLLQEMHVQTNFKYRITNNEFRITDGNTETIFRKNEEKQSNSQSRSGQENEGNKTQKWNLTHLERNKRRKWQIHNSTDSFVGALRRWIYSGTCDTNRLSKRTSSVSYELQSRPCLSIEKIGDRGGWQKPQMEKRIVKRCQESGMLGKFRVESCEIFQRGHNEQLFRDSFTDKELAQEYVTMYDLQVEGHPSYFVNNVLVHNCHMLTVQSQNALLKILEEPPSHCIYILCTTDPQKVLGTIMSRAFRYDFQLISQQGIVSRLQYILEQEQKDPEGCGIVSWDQDALNMIAVLAAGHMRNAIAMLDKVISFTKTITVKDIEKVSGASDYGMLFDILDCLITKNQAILLQKINEVSTSGMDLKLFIKNFLSFILDVNKYVILKTEAPNNDPMALITIPTSYINRLMVYNQSHKSQLKSILRLLIELNSSIRWETNVKPVLETNLLLEVL